MNAMAARRGPQPSPNTAKNTARPPTRNAQPPSTMPALWSFRCQSQSSAMTAAARIHPAPASESIDADMLPTTLTWCLPFNFYLFTFNFGDRHLPRQRHRLAERLLVHRAQSHHRAALTSPRATGGCERRWMQLHEVALLVRCHLHHALFAVRVQRREDPSVDAEVG